MRRIGVLGGMSWESTAEYYRLLNTEVAARLGGLHSADLLLRSVDFATVEELQVAGAWDRAGELLGDAAAELEAGGAELLVLATNTMHKVADAIQARTRIPLLHLGDTTASAVRAAQVHRVGLLGTAFTMEQDFYVDRLRSHGLDVVVPPAEDRAEVHRVIYDELCRGQVLDSSRDAYLEVIGRLADRGCTGVILGCTEIELLLPMAAAHGTPLFPTTRLHVAAAVDAALAP
ncbi:MAG: aspartate/glutamate racemase family protein [Nocardioidaceae bacterium]